MSGVMATLRTSREETPALQASILRHARYSQGKAWSDLSASDRFPSLMASQFGLATEDDAPRLSTLATLPGSCPNQFALKFGQSA